MAFWDYIFNKSKVSEGPFINFGRFSDAYKDASQYDAWDKSLQAFEHESYLESIRYFMEYLNDPDIKNARWWEEDGRLHFQLYQGSKKIIGVADSQKLRCEAQIAKGDQLNVGLLRRLIEHNYALKYSRYALDSENYITIVFDTFILDGSPYKLYYALKEIATQADKQDDLLISEFSLTSINTGHIQSLPETEKSVKFRYYQSQIRAMMDILESYHQEAHRFPEGIGYILLAMCYKLDYLIAPEGTITEAFERIHRTYMASDKKTLLQKITMVQQEFKKLNEIQVEDFNRQLYRTTSTFGIASPVSHQQICELIKAELNKMDWFEHEKFASFRIAVPGYIVGYALFNYALPEPIKDLFQLYYKITENSFFTDLGFSEKYIADDGQLDKKMIKRSFKEIDQIHKPKYPKIDLKTSHLDFSEISSFAKSFLTLIYGLDLTTADA